MSLCNFLYVKKRSLLKQIEAKQEFIKIIDQRIEYYKEMTKKGQERRKTKNAIQHTETRQKKVRKTT